MSNDDDFTWGEVTAAVRDGRLAITLAGAPCPMSLQDLEQYDLLGRIRLAGDRDVDRRKFSVIAVHRGTGKLVRFYVIDPIHPAADPDLASRDLPPWLSAHLRGSASDLYASQRAVWDRLSQLTDIANVTIGTPKDFETKETPMPTKSEIVTSPHQIRGVAMDVINAARGGNSYPRLVDRGAHVAVVMATTAVLVRAAAERTDVGVEHILSQARKSIVEGRQNGTITVAEANVMVTVLQLADPRRDDQRITFDRAESWSENRGLLDSLDVIVAGVDLLRFITTLTPDADAALDALAVELMEADLASGTSTEGEDK